MSHNRKSLLYISFIALGFTAACANADKEQLAPPAETAVTAPSAPAVPADMTLDGGVPLTEKSNAPQAIVNPNTMSDGAVISVSSGEKVADNVVITNNSAEKTSIASSPEVAQQEPEKPYNHRETIVSRKVTQLEKDLDKVSEFVDSYDIQIKNIQVASEKQASDYFNLVAAIQSRLQGGSTPGNPILVEQLQASQKQLDALASSVGELNKLSSEISANASVASFLLESVRATYSLSGAVEEDHEKLTKVEDRLNGTIVRIDRQLNDLSDDVNRRASYLATERRNLQTIALAVANGEPYGQSLARKAYGPVSTLTGVTNPTSGGSSFDRPQGNRPMIIIRFDRPKVEYQQAVYLAASEALEKYPDATFEIVAVTPARGNAAQRALASSDARQNAEEVFRTMVEMGIPSSRVKLAAAQSPSAGTTEVHIFLR